VGSPRIGNDFVFAPAGVAAGLGVHFEKDKSVKPRLRRRQAALRPAIPPPTITTGYFSVRFAAGNPARSRRRWPIWKESLTNDPSILFSLLSERPTSAALPRPRELAAAKLQ